MKENEIVTINARKFDNRIHRSWQCRLIEDAPEYFVFYGEFESEINHKQLGVIRPGTISYEYYWKNEFFNVFCFYQPDGEFRNFYCNVNMPPIFKNNILDYVDLDIDVVVWKDFTREILDMDEFEMNMKKYSYPAAVRNAALQTLDVLLRKIDEKSFPFDLHI